tara:strand:- start:1938 stop:4625 length:2688 start_codon:yes stop_codon:yes gene_type:complete
MPSLVDSGAYLDQLYQEKFGRVPDAEGKAYWKKQLESGAATPESVANAFDNSDEAKRVKESKAQEARDFLEKTYAEELGREPDASGAEYWANEISSGRQTQEQVVNNIRQSEEYQERQAPEEEEWQQEYDNQFNQATNDLSRTDISQQADIPAQEREADPTSDPEQPVPSQAERKREAAEADATAFLNQVYREELGRGPDEEGLQYWKDQITSGNQTQEDVLANIRRSDEYQENQQDIEVQEEVGNADDVTFNNANAGGEDFNNLYNDTFTAATGGGQAESNDDDPTVGLPYIPPGSDQEKANQINQIYRDVLERDSDNEGANYWLEELKSGRQTLDDIRANISRSDEAANLESNKAFIEEQYQSGLDRGTQDNVSDAADPYGGGMGYWLKDLATGQSREDVAANIRRSDEFSTQAENYLDNLYENILERDPDDEGLQYWKEQLTSGNQTRQEVEANINRSDEKWLGDTYKEELGRSLGDEGREYWLEDMNERGQTREQVLANIRRSDEYLNRGEQECPTGQHLENGVCVNDAVTECPEGQRVENGRCVSDVRECPEGTEWDGTQCRATGGDREECPTGTYRNEDGNCVGFGICPDGSSTRDHEGGVCPDVEEEEVTECPAGQTRNAAGECIPETIGEEEVDEDPIQCQDGYTRNEAGVCVEDPGTWTGEDPTDPGEEEDEEDIGNYMGTDPTEGTDPGTGAENEGEGTYMGTDPTEEIEATEDETRDPLDITDPLTTTEVLTGGLPRRGANPGERTGQGAGKKTEVRGDMGYRQTRNEYQDLYNAAMRDMASLNDRGEEDRVRYGELQSRYGKLRADYEAARREADSYRDAQRADETSRLRSGITVGGAPGSRRNSLRSGNTATSDRSRRRGVSARSNRGRDRSPSMQGIRSGF